MNEQSIKLEQLIKFIKKVKKFYKYDSPTVYLDNLRLHYNKEFVALANDNDIDLLYGPIHASIYNPVERLWAYSKLVF